MKKIPLLLGVSGWFTVLISMIGATAAQTTPEIDYLFPAGAQRGTKALVAMSGKYMPGPCGLSVRGQGLSADRSIVSDQFALTIAPDATLGPHEIRIFAAQGGSPPFPFLVGELPELIRTENEELLEPELPTTINARLDLPRALHRYKLQLEAGQQIVCASMARAFGSPVDANMRLLDANGQLVASSFTHHSADALLVFRAPHEGQYTLQVFDFQLAGGPQYIYRLTLTDGPWLDYAFPTGVAENTASTISLYGWNLPGENDRLMQYPIAGTKAGSFDVTLPGCVNRLSLRADDCPSLQESEPNNLQDQATELTTPITVHGRLAVDGDVDMFCFAAKKGDRLEIDVDSASLHFPLDGVATILDETGKKLLEVDDAKTSRDPSLQFTAPADGRFYVQLRDRSERGGEEFVYRMRMGALRPDVEARVELPSFALTSGQTANLPVKIERVDGFDGELEVTAIDLPAGVTVAPQQVPKGAAATVQLPLSAAENLAPVSGLIQVVVRLKDSGEPREWIASIVADAKAKTGSSKLWLAVSPEIPFTLKTTTTILEAPCMAAFPFPVAVQRNEGFHDSIRLVGVEPDRRGTVVPLEGSIAANSNQGAIPLVVQHGTTEGTTQRCRVMGVVDVVAADGKSYPVFHIAPGNMLMGCAPCYLALSVEPLIVRASPGETHLLRVQLMRRVEMGEIKLRLELPPGVTGVECDPVTVSESQAEGLLTLRIAADALFPPRTHFTIKAESTRAALPVLGQTSFRLETP